MDLYVFALTHDLARSLPAQRPVFVSMKLALRVEDCIHLLYNSVLTLNTTIMG
jgi:hypothetical protein